MKIYLLNAPFMENFVRCGRWQGVAARGGTLYYPIWLSYATGILENAGHEVRLIDAIACHWDLDSVRSDAKKFNPDLVVIDSNFSSLGNDCIVASSIGNDTGAVSVLVGPPVSQYAEIILKKHNVDIAARYEYDFTIRDIAATIEEEIGYKDVLGISYKDNDKIIHNPNRPYITSEELDEIPFVSQVYRKHLQMEDYFLGHTLNPMVQIFTGRGCPNQCTFCSWPETLMGREYRIRSVKNVVDEFESISTQMQEVKEIFIEDDTFTISKKRIRDLCIEIKRRGLDITWSCNARANLDYESMNIMKDAGCRLLDVGYESGSDQILKSIRKGISTSDSISFSKDAKKAGLMILGDFIIGMPGETKETADETIKFIKQIKPNIVQISVATPMPGTKFYDFVKDKGFLLTSDLTESLDINGFQRCIISYPDFKKEDIERYVDRGLKEYYLSPTYFLIAAKTIFRKNGIEEMSGLIKSARIFLKYIWRNH